MIGTHACRAGLPAFAVAAARGAPGDVTGLLAAAAGLSLLYSAATGRAAPVMFQVGRAGDGEAALTPLLTRFARWSAARVALQAATLVVVAIAGRRRQPHLRPDTAQASLIPKLNEDTRTGEHTQAAGYRRAHTQGRFCWA